MGKTFSGFTLIEMLLVIVLLAVLSVVAMSKFSLNPFYTAGFEQELRAALRFAQKFAMASGCHVQVRTDAAAESYALFLRDDVGPSADSCLTAVAGFNTPLKNPVLGGSFAGQAPSGVNLNTTIAFFYDQQGRPSVAGALIDVDGRNIIVENETGFVH